MGKGFWQQGGGELPVDIALCICPHLREFLAVDQRRHLPGRPVVQVLSTELVFDEEFYQQVERDLSHTLRQRERPFTTFMALPQVVEAVVRQRSLEAILRAMDIGITQAMDTPRVAILLFSGETLTLDEKDLAQAIRDLLGSETDEETVTTAQQHLSRLLAGEREFESQVQQDWLRKIIKGNTGDFFTLWQQPQ